MAPEHGPHVAIDREDHLFDDISAETANERYHLAHLHQVAGFSQGITN